MESIFNSTALPETNGSTWLIAESAENVATVANAERLYATEVSTFTPEDWPLQ